MDLRKFTLFAIPAVTALSLLITGCSKSNNNNNSSTSITATVGTSSWSPNVYNQAIYVKDSGYFDIGAVQYVNKDSSAIDLSFGVPVVLNQKLSTANNDQVYMEYDDNGYFGKIYIAQPGYGSGFLTVTSYDSTNHKIAGTFSGVLYNYANSNDSVVITNGKFDANYKVF